MTPPIVYEGPCQIDCPEKCNVPAGARLAMVPKPRHAWSDVFGCPNDGCERWWLISAAAPAVTEEER